MLHQETPSHQTDSDGSRDEHAGAERSLVVGALLALRHPDPMFNAPYRPTAMPTFLCTLPG